MRRTFAFLKRNLLEMLSYKSAFLLDSTAIVFQILIFFFISKLIPETQPGLPPLGGGAYFPFVLTGITFSLYQSTALQSFSSAIAREQESGTLEMILVTTSPWVLLGAGFFWHFLYTSVRVLLYLCLGLLINAGGAFPSIDFPALCLILGLMLTALSGLGFFSAGYFLRHKKGDPVSFFISGISKILSGVFFPIAILPLWVQGFSALLPLTHALKAIRGILLEGLGVGDLGSEILWLGIFSLFFLPAGLWYFSQSFSAARREGSLGYQ